MNTDNMALSGETIDYGPCAFMDAYDPATVFSSIDRQGRYAYGNQPAIAQWNLTRLAEALVPVLHNVEGEAVELAQAALQDFGLQFHRNLLAGWRRKLGLFNAEVEDVALVEALLAWMQKAKADFTNTFAALAMDAEREGRKTGGEGADAGAASVRLVAVDSEFIEWRARWIERLGRQAESPGVSARLRRENCPAVIPRNHLVEAALAAAEQGNLAPMNRLFGVLAKPFAHGESDGSGRHPVEFRTPADAVEGAEPYQTFCGT
jgi:uncharacterized protein YdiU (UPF0061 family)